jgi:hypothetical protein
VLGPAKRGRLFWDRWLREYYAVRVCQSWSTSTGS